MEVSVKALVLVAQELLFKTIAVLSPRWLNGTL
nr:MAG TPA: hypothetical protein [Caudoviricetes sp.]